LQHTTAPQARTGTQRLAEDTKKGAACERYIKIFIIKYQKTFQMNAPAAPDSIVIEHPSQCRPTPEMTPGGLSSFPRVRGEQRDSKSSHF
jgi:hypothetical protein